MSRKNKSRKLEVEAAVKASPRGDGSMGLTSAQRWVRWLAPLLVALFTLAAFLPALQNQFVNWDDKDNFLDNPHYRGLGWTHLRWMWTTHLGHYIPLTWMTLGLDYLLWGMNPVGYHLTNLLLHAANAVVFFFVVRRILTLALPSSERGHALAVSAGGAVGWWSEPARRVYVEKIPFVLLAAAASAIAVMAQLSFHAALSVAQLSVPGRLAISAYGLSFYLWKLVAPVNLSPLYELPP